MSRQHLYSAPSTISEQIRQEIQRFESVHPCIYSIYDLIDLIPDPILAQQIRENVVCIEDSFVNSQEWTLSRCVPDLKLGVVGSLLSGKSALVHRYLTGAYMQEESPEGGRFKKEVVIDGQPYVLLIRDEGGPPEQQFAHWVDAVIFVFSVENEQSFNAVYNFYAKMAHFRNTADIPMILVGTQDAISESNPRVIDDSRARKLANDLKRCTYYETCATYGLNVERVFRDACVKIIQQRQLLLHQQHNHVSPSPSTSISCQSGAPGAVAFPPSSCPNTPSHQSANGHQARFNFFPSSAAAAVATPATASSSSSNSVSQAHHHRPQVDAAAASGGGSGGVASYSHSSLYGHHHHSASLVSSTGGNYLHSYNNNNNSSSSTTNVAVLAPSIASPIRKQTSGSTSSNSPTFLASGVSPTASNHSVCSLQQYQPYQSTPAASGIKADQEARQSSGGSGRERGGIVNLTFNDNTIVDGNQLATPSSTPTTQRKNRRISNIFNRKDDDKMKNGSLDPAGIGVGRAIPVKQGFLYKRSSKSLNKEWKKKYVCLYDDARLTYHPNIKDYMDDTHGKDVFLGHTTVKVPGQRPRGAQQRAMTQPITTNGLVGRDMSAIKMGKADRVHLTGFDMIQENRAGENSFATPAGTSDDSSRFETPNLKKKEKKHLRKPGGVKSSENEDGETFDFIIVSIDNRQWHFEANTAEERDEWVLAIEQKIFSSLQGNESNKRLSNSRACGDRSKVQALRNIPGNAFCADCGASDPDWVSMNLGAMICIECSGIHRNLGTHISKVRSLDLDELPLEHINVMQSLGNTRVNAIWEHDTKGRQKPSPNSSRDVKEAWIRSKYEKKEFLTPLPSSSLPLTAQLTEAMFKKDLQLIVFLLAHCTTAQINAAVGPKDLRTPLHLAAAIGSSILTQLLLWYNADVSAVDHDGRTALWYAKNSGSQECIDILIRNGCTIDFISSTGPTSTAMPNLSLSTHSQNSNGGGGGSGGGGGRQLSTQQPQQNESQSDSSTATLNKRKQPGAVGAGTGTGNGPANVSSRNSCGSAFEKLPASVI